MCSSRVGNMFGPPLRHVIGCDSSDQTRVAPTVGHGQSQSAVLSLILSDRRDCVIDVNALQSVGKSNASEDTDSLIGILGDDLASEVANAKTSRIQSLGTVCKEFNFACDSVLLICVTNCL